MISLIVQYTRESIAQEIKATDNANLEQLSFVLKFVDQDCQIRQEFLDFQCTHRITGEVISGLILGRHE